MDRRDHRIGLGHDDGTGVDGFVVFTFPMFVESRKRKQPPLRRMKAVGLLTVRSGLPFVETGSGNDTAVGFERRSKGWFGLDGLRPRIDGAVSELFVLRPEGNQAPVQIHPFTALCADSNRPHRLGGRDIIAGQQVRDLRQLEHPGQFLGSDIQIETSTHFAC